MAVRDDLARRITSAAQQFRRELAAAGGDDGVLASDAIRVEPTEDGVALHFFDPQPPKADKPTSKRVNPIP